MNDSASRLAYDDISPAMRAFIGTRETLRRIGYSADDLFCTLGRSAKNGGRLSGFCLLRVDGRDFSIELGPCDESFGDEYERTAYVINAGGVAPRDLERMFVECEARERVVDLLIAIKGKGIAWPSEAIQAYEAARAAAVKK